MIDVSTVEKPLLLQGDCLDLMGRIPEKSVDFIFTDLPFGTTQNAWDKKIPLEDHVFIDGFRFNEAEYMLYAYGCGVPHGDAIGFWKEHRQLGLWSHYKRIIKDRGCIALFCQVPFDVALGQSNLSMLKYEWIIEKTKATGFLNAKKAPLKAHEKLLIFYKKAPTYNPQMSEGHPPVHSYTKRKLDWQDYGQVREVSGGGSTLRYPRDVILFKWDTQKSKLHPTQKPVEMLEYYIKTYTNPGDLVLDSCMGSGSTGVACVNTGRKFIGIELKPQIFGVAAERIGAIASVLSV